MRPVLGLCRAAKALGVTAFVLDYRRAPEHPHPAQVEDGVAAFTARGIEPEDITTIGDSAGGNLAIAIPLALREKGLPLPGRVIAFSPWLDMENSGETLVTNDATDALITVPLLVGMIAGVLAEWAIDPKTPLACRAGVHVVEAAHRRRGGLGNVPGGVPRPERAVDVRGPA